MNQEEDEIDISDPKNLLKILLKKDSIGEYHKNEFSIKYLGEKSSPYFNFLINNFPLKDNKIDEIKSFLNNKEDIRNYIVLIKYKDIYNGGLSILDFKSRIRFGLNIYLNNIESTFYFGQWKNNQKSGIGFIKTENSLYIGNFLNNQISGYGLLYNKETGNYYYGQFSKGIFQKGFNCNFTKDIYYIGGFVNNKKYDKFCCYFNSKKNKLYLGNIKDDLFIKGHIINLKITEMEDKIIIKIESIYSYDRSNQIYLADIISIKNDKIFEEITYDLLQNLEILKQKIIEINKLFRELEEAFNEDSYNEQIENNYFSLENEFIEAFNGCFGNLDEIQNKLNLNEIQNKIHK